MCEVTQIIAVFMVLSLPIREPACFYVFFFFPPSVLQKFYSVHTVLNIFLKFISRYYIFSDSTVNGVFPFIILSDQTAIYCSVRVLYLTNFILTLLTVFLFTSPSSSLYSQMLTMSPPHIRALECFPFYNCVG